MLNITRNLSILFVCTSFEVNAAQELKGESQQKNCWHEAGKRYQIDPILLYSIAQIESDLNSLAVNYNKPKQGKQTRDVGLMQINSFWFPKLKKWGITEKSLFDPCTNINVGAWILAQNFSNFGKTWRAVGAYNAGTRKNETAERLRENYAYKVHKRYAFNVKRLRGKSRKE